MRGRDSVARNRAGSGALEQATTVRKAQPIRSMLGRALREHTDERAWRRGGEGEQRLARLLEPLRSRGWYVFHDIRVRTRNANIDHLVIGPGGIMSRRFATFSNHETRTPGIDPATALGRILLEERSDHGNVAGIIDTGDALVCIKRSAPRRTSTSASPARAKAATSGALMERLRDLHPKPASDGDTVPVLFHDDDTDGGELASPARSGLGSGETIRPRHKPPSTLSPKNGRPAPAAGSCVLHHRRKSRISSRGSQACRFSPRTVIAGDYAVGVCDTMQAFDLGPGRTSGLRLRVRGSNDHGRALLAAFPEASWIGPLESFGPQFTFVYFIHNIDEPRLRRFLGFLSETLLCRSSLDACWALDWHMKAPDERTDVGKLVFDAKTYTNKPGNPRAAEELARHIVERASAHPSIATADYIVGVRANPIKAPHNLPELLAGRIAAALNRPLGDGILVKVRPTPEIKNLEHEEKLAAIAGAFEIRKPLHGRTVVLVDDLMRSGTTLSVIGDALRRAGAARIIGLVATKTWRG